MSCRQGAALVVMYAINQFERAKSEDGIAIESKEAMGPVRSSSVTGQIATVLVELVPGCLGRTRRVEEQIQLLLW